MIITPELLSQIVAVYEQGLYLQAYEQAWRLGPLEEWSGTEARLLAGRLASQLGGDRLSRRLFRRAWREDRQHPEARYYRARVRLGRSGPLAAWELLGREGDFPEAGPAVRGMWFSFRASVAAHLRDFEVADAWIARAEQEAPEDPRIAVERAMVLEQEDRYEEALTAARQALTLRPWYRPGVQALAHLLQLVGDDDEALALLTAAAERIESPSVAGQLTLIQTEKGLWEDARRSLDRVAALVPLADEEMTRWLASRRSDVFYHLGDLDGAIEQARVAGDPFHQAIVARLTAHAPSPAAQSAAPNEPPCGVLLPVGFVRQHHMTCVPATLATISRYWSMPADHLEVAEAICYDGTPDHSERSWAEENGWATWEFTVTWESAIALLDRGVPFTLITSDPTNAHLQAVIGYDRRRGTLLIRDPYVRHHGECLAEEALQALRSSGPRGMALVPCQQAGLLTGLELPDAALYDRYHQLQRALVRHDRAEAHRIAETLREIAPDHRLTLMARRSLAAYDSDSTELLGCAERLLELYPEDGGALLLKLAGLRELARREERLALLKEVCTRKGSHPIFRSQYAQELAPDAREHPAAIRLLRRAVRAQPSEGGNLYLLARLLWDQRRLDEALRLFRIAACLEEKNEAISQGYFYASRHLRQTGATLQFLKHRFERFGRQSSQPARTLFWALSELDRSQDAFQVLEAALRLRPEDGELRLFATDVYGRHGAFDRAAGHLAAAEGKTQRTAWLRAASELALRQGDLQAALEQQRQVVEAEPLDVATQRSVAQLLAETVSRAIALAYLRNVVERFPHHSPLHQLWIEWLREEEPAELEAAVRHLININPVDAWAHQELALTLAAQGRLDEAFPASEMAGRLDPTSPGRWCVHGQVCAHGGRLEEAREAYRQAIRLSVDLSFAITALVESCDTSTQRREALAFVESELAGQTIFGEGLLTFRAQARGTLAPEELLASLRKALRARPDLWHAWSAVTCQLIDMDRLDEALHIARQATDRFPLLPQLWLDLAKVCEARADRPGEKEALEQALRIGPGWGQAVVQLASLYERTGEFTAAKCLLEQAVARTPLDPLCHGWLAQTRWRLGEKKTALRHVERALELEPGYEWAWQALQRYARDLEGPAAGDKRAAALARRLAERRPGEARSWLVLAQMLSGTAALEERLTALDRAIELRPRLTDAYEMKAELLAEAGRIDAALAVCRPELWGDAPPAPLRVRAAGVEAARGAIQEAIAQLRAVVEDEPHYFRAWGELARCYDQTGAGPEYLEVAEKMVQLEPQNPVSFAILADARLQTGDRQNAKAAFRRSFDLDPDYAFAGMSLFDLQLEDGELDEVARTLERLRTHLGGTWVLARETQLAARREDRSAATRCLRELCLAPSEDAWPLHAAAGAIAEAGWSETLDETFEETIEWPEVNPQVGALWVRSRLARGDWECGGRLPALLARGAVGREAACAYLELLAEVGRGTPLRRFVKQHGAQLRQETATWASAGYGLLTMGDRREAALWLADWQSRADLKPWMLIPLVVALRAAGRDTEAAAASRHALTLEEQDARSGCHAVWLAVDAVLAGDTGAAANHLAATDPLGLNPYYRFLHALAQEALAVRGRKQDAQAATMRERLRAAAPLPGDWICPALRRAHRRLVLQIAHDLGGAPAMLWAWWRIGVAGLRSELRT